jgi:hypothetical protein
VLVDGREIPLMEHRLPIEELNEPALV